MTLSFWLVYLTPIYIMCSCVFICVQIPDMELKNIIKLVEK